MRYYLTFLLSFLNFYFVISQLNRPHTPDITIEYQQFPVPGFYFTLNNTPISNNYNEAFEAFDNSIDSSAQDRTWNFQGYLVFQLLNDTISPQDPFISEFYHLAKIIDINDSISLINLNWDGCQTELIYLNNLGTTNSFLLNQDVFTGLPFVEGQNYCFNIYSFATNEYALDTICNNSNFALIGRVNSINGVQFPICTVANSLEIYENEENGVSIFPNPNNGFIQLNNLNNSSPIHITVFNSIGQIVDDFINQSSSITYEFQTKGVFTIRLIQEGKISCHKILSL